MKSNTMKNYAKRMASRGFSAERVVQCLEARYALKFSNRGRTVFHMIGHPPNLKGFALVRAVWSESQPPQEAAMN